MCFKKKIKFLRQNIRFALFLLVVAIFTIKVILEGGALIVLAICVGAIIGYLQAKYEQTNG